jgi:predicted chitinase
VAKINITVSGTTYDGDLDLAGDSGFQSLITELKGLRTTLSSKGKPSSGATIDVVNTQKALDSLTDSATNAAKSLDSLEKSASNVSQAFGQSASQAASMGSSMSAVSAASQGLNTSLAQMSNMTSNAGTSLAQMSSMTGSAGTSLAQMSGMVTNTGGSLAQMSGMLGKNTKGLVGMASKANLYIAAASLVIEGLAGVVTALSTFTNFLFTGGTRLSDFTEALHKSVSELPIVGGALGLFTGVLATVTKTLDSYLDSLEATSAAGASFNNNIMLMRSAATQTGQSMEQFASTVSANTEKFAQFGTVTEGALKFAKVSETVRKDLRNLGFSAQEVNDTLPTIMSVFSQGAQGSSLTTDQMANSAKSLMTEMDAMAKLTGKSRKEQADAQAKTMQDAAMRMKMASMTEDQQKALNEAMIQARAKFGESGAEMVKLRILGIAPQTEAQRNFQAVMGGAMKSVTDYTDGVVNGTGVIKDDVERKKKLDEATMKSQVGVMKTAKQFGTQLAVASAGGANVLAGSSEAIQIAAQNKLKADGTLDEAEQKRKNEETRLEQQRQEETTKALKDFDETMKDLKKTLFDEVIMPLFQYVKPTLLGFVEQVKSGVQNLIESFKDPSSFINTTLVPNLKSFGDIITGTVWPALQWVGGFLMDNWKPIMVGIGAALGALVVSFAIANAPIIAIGVAAGLLYKGFQMLKDNGWSLGMILETVGDGFKSVFNSLQDSVLSLVEKFGKFVGMDTSWIGEKRKQIAEEQKLLDQKAKDREEQRQKNAEAAKGTAVTGTSTVSQAQLANASAAGGTVSAELMATMQSATGLSGTPLQTEQQKTQGVAIPPMKMSQDKQKNVDLLTAELKKKGFNQGQIAAVLGNVAKESGFQTRSENLDYSKTSNERIRSIFGARASGKTDAELDVIKKDPKQMGEMMYGAGTKVGQGMGNTEPGDGFKYRGRGFIQLTGKNNYAAASKAIFGDNRLVDNPDLASDPAVAAQISAWFTEKQGKGMAKKMGVDLASASQEDLNRVYTSAIAGREIKKGETGYLGGEVMSKVSAYAQQFGGIPTAPSSTPSAPSGGTVVASVTPTPAAVSPLPTPVTAESAQTRTPAKASGDSGILSTLRELVDLQYKANRMLSTISANV